MGRVIPTREDEGALLSTKQNDTLYRVSAVYVLAILLWLLLLLLLFIVWDKGQFH